MRLPIIFGTAASFAFALAVPHGGPSIHERSAAAAAPEVKSSHSNNIHQARNAILPRAYNQNQAGAVLLKPPTADDAFTSVTGTFTVPTIAVPRGGNAATKYSASIWLGIANNKNQDAVLQAGITMSLQRSQSTFYSWSGWTPDKSANFTTTEFAVKTGDSIKITITTTSATQGTVVLENTTTSRKVTKTVAAPASLDPSALTAQSVAAIVEGYQVNGGLPDLVDFTRVQFTKVAAGTTGGKSVGVTGSGIYEVQTTSGAVLTKTTVPGADQVLVTFVK